MKELDVTKSFEGKLSRIASHSNFQNKLSKTAKKSNFITKDNIFACNLKFSNLFLRKPWENECDENDDQFLDNYEKLKLENEDNSEDIQNLSTNITKETQCDIDSLGSSGEFLNGQIIKLIDSPSKNDNSNEQSKSQVHEPRQSHNQNQGQTQGNQKNSTKKIIVNKTKVIENVREYGLGLNQRSQNQIQCQSQGDNNYDLNNCNGKSYFYNQGHILRSSGPTVPLINMDPNNFQRTMPVFPMQINMYNNYLMNYPNQIPNNVNFNSLMHSNQNSQNSIIEEKNLLNMKSNNSMYVADSPNNVTNKLKDFTNQSQSPCSSSIYQQYSEMNEEELLKNSKLLCKDQGGCRYLQKLLETSKNFASNLYQHLEPDLIELINDSFGNYLIQKLLEKLSPIYIEKVLKKIENFIMSMGINSHGTRVLQKIIEMLSTNDQIDRFSNHFSHCVITFCNDINGNHIIQKFISTIQYPKNQFVYNIIKKNISTIGLNKHGCCALQKCIEFGSEKQRDEMINETIKHCRSFITDQYGNYVLQNIISYKNFNANKLITGSFINDIVKLSKEKFSSNVIEKCMDYCDKETKDKILKKLANKDCIAILLMDMYGNYVIQKALQISTEKYFSVFIKYIGPMLNDLRELNFGQKLFTKFINNYPEFSEYVEVLDYDENIGQCKGLNTGLGNDQLRERALSNIDSPSKKGSFLEKKKQYL
jgi:hypothetical protein